MQNVDLYIFFCFKNLQGGVAMVGQLGHGDLASYKAPHRVDALLGVQVQQVACGEDFTLCVTGKKRMIILSNYS